MFIPGKPPVTGDRFTAGDMVKKEFGDSRLVDLENKMSALGKRIDELRAKIIKIRDGEIDDDMEASESELFEKLEVMKQLREEQRVLNKKFEVKK